MPPWSYRVRWLRGHARHGLGKSPEESGRVSTDRPNPVETLYMALWQLVETAATLDAIAGQAALLGLTSARGAEPEADDYRLAQLARDEIIDACRGLDDRALAVEPRWQR